jgi:septal ring factor EnvC (AmiA/AmiB activator)
MTELLELTRRADALEVAQNETTQTMRWVVAKLGRVSAVQDEHTLRLDGIDSRLDRVESRLDRVESRLDRIEIRLDRVEKKIDDLTTRLPTIIADTMREVLKERE